MRAGLLSFPLAIWQNWRRRAWQIVGGVSIRTKILGIVLAMVVFPGLMVTFQVRSRLVYTLREQLRQQSISVARDVAARSADLVLINDLYALNRLLRDTQAHNPDVRYIFVMDPGGRVLAHTFDGGFPLDLLSVPLSLTDRPHRIQPLLTEEGLIWDTAVPVFEGRAGIARVGLSEQRLWHTVNSVTGQIMLSTLIISLVGVGAASVLTWLLTRPIRELVTAAERIGQGDYSPRVRRWAEDEIGDLAEAFNAMAVRLAQAEAERAERERMRQFYLKRVIRAQEEERRRIARELHDETGQALASLMVGLRNVEEAPTPEEMRYRLQDLRRILATTLDRVRRLAFDLRPSVLDDLGLVAALRRYAQRYRERFGIAAEVEAVGLEDLRLTPEVETTVYRIVQEAMTNAAKYAACAHLSVLLQAHDGQLSVIVEDDGTGFDVEEVFRSEAGQTKLGLYGMQERAELIGGRLDIEARLGTGTSIYLRVPLEGTTRGAQEGMSHGK
ncbi:MAG: HAMP domain-containing protein [Chloroflexi bacterium]|nr:HAMP domain-containing protein [Chloroflexota bacterium]